MDARVSIVPVEACTELPAEDRSAELADIARLREELARLLAENEGMRRAKDSSWRRHDIDLLRRQLEELEQRNAELLSCEAQNKKMRKVNLGEIKDGKCVMDLTPLRLHYAQPLVARRTTVFRKSLDIEEFDDVGEARDSARVMDLTAFRG